MKQIKNSLFLSIIVLFTNCNTPSSLFNNRSKWIPENFDAEKAILLVETFDYSYNPKLSALQQEEMEVYMRKQYPYRYEFSTYSRIMNKDKRSKYNTNMLYRYALLISRHTRAPMFPTQLPIGDFSFDLYFYDRELNLSYPVTGRGSSYIFRTFQPVINTIIRRQEYNEKKLAAGG